MNNSADLRFEYEFGCLIVRATGRYLIDEKEPAILAIARAIKDQPVCAALVDMRGLEGLYSFMDRYSLAELAGRHLIGVPLGVLARAEQLDPQRLGVLVAKNRGVDVNIFTDPTEAQAWLT